MNRLMTCQIGDCDRPVKAGGMCRHHREEHLNSTMHNIGPAKQRAVDLIDHYGTIGLAARMIGVSRNTLVRVQHAEVGGRITNSAYTRIMNHQAGQVPSQGEALTGAEVAAYALTREGRAFVAECMGRAA